MKKKALVIIIILLASFGTFKSYMQSQSIKKIEALGGTFGYDFMTLRAVTLRKRSVSNDDIKVIENFKYLQHLDIAYTQVSEITSIIKIETLTDLSIHKGQFSKEQLEELKRIISKLEIYEVIPDYIPPN